MRNGFLEVTTSWPQRTLARVQDIDLAVGSPPEIRGTASSVLLTFRGTSDRRSGDRDTRIRMSLPTRLAIEAN